MLLDHLTSSLFRKNIINIGNYYYFMVPQGGGLYLLLMCPHLKNNLIALLIPTNMQLYLLFILGAAVLNIPIK